MKTNNEEIIYNVYINKEVEDNINKILNYITKKDFPALITLKKCYSKLNKHNDYIKKLMDVEQKHAEQILNIYKTRIVILYIINMIDNDKINTNTNIKKIINYLNVYSDKCMTIDSLKNDILNKIKLADKRDKIKLCKKYKELKKEEPTLNYNILSEVFSIKVNSINRHLDNKYTINLCIDNIQSEIINSAIETIANNKNDNITINIIKNKKLEKKL